MPSLPLESRPRCWTIWCATRTGWRSPTIASSASRRFRSDCACATCCRVAPSASVTTGLLAHGTRQRIWRRRVPLCTQPNRRRQRSRQPRALLRRIASLDLALPAMGLALTMQEPDVRLLSAAAAPADPGARPPPTRHDLPLTRGLRGLSSLVRKDECNEIKGADAIQWALPAHRILNITA